MEQADFLRDVIGRLESISLPYCITGSIAGNFYGIPRLTHDMDVVVMLKKDDVKPLIEAFEKDSYIDESSVIKAIRDRRMFNVIHHKTGLKVDFWILKGDEYNRNFFERRKREEIISGVSAWLATPEDVILSKLLWHKMTPSERQLNDAKGILEVQAGRLDLTYLQQWAKKIKVSVILKDVKNAPLPNRY